MRKMLHRRRITGILAGLLILAGSVAGAQEARTDATGQWHYVLEDGGAIITEYAEETEGRLTIPRELDGIPVTGIGADALGDCEGLTEVILPDTVTHIGGYAFPNCESIYLPESVTNIAPNAFYGCYWASEWYSERSGPILRVREDSVAAQHARLRGFPFVLVDENNENPRQGAVTIGWPYAVAQDGTVVPEWRQEENVEDDLEEDEGDEDAPYIEEDEEEESVLTVPFGEMDGAEVTLGFRAYYYMVYWDSLIIQEGVTIIGDHVFCESKTLESVVIPDSVTHIGAGAFCGCASFTEVDIPAGVTSIGGNPFTPIYGHGYGLQSIHVSPENPRYEDIDGVLFDKQEKMLITYPAGRAGPYAVPEGVRSIGGSAFLGADSLTDLTLPDSVTDIGSGTFSECFSLTRVNLPQGMTSIEDSLFADCESLASVVIPDSVTRIGDYAFYNSSLTGVDIPPGVTTIGEGAFSWGDLRSLTIPEGVAAIGDEAFAYNANLSSVSIPASLTDIGEKAFVDCALTEIEVSPDNPRYAQAEGALIDKEEGALLLYPTAREGPLAVPEGVNRINASAFAYCRGLTGIILPDSVTSMGEQVFFRSENLAQVTLPENLTRISDYAFYYCTSLKDLRIPGGVTGIGSAAFSYSGLTGVTIPGNVASIGGSAFAYCESLTTVALEDGVEHIGDQAFGNCESLASVTIPASVTRIGEGAFHIFYYGSTRVNPGVTLTVEPGSYAAEYAVQQGIPYILMAPDERMEEE